jgi:hypothetical protein
MNIPPKPDFNPKVLPKLEKLQDVTDYLKKIKSDIHSGKISPQDVDFIPIFHSIQKIVNSANLRNIITEFKNSSELFSRKIQEIRAYISSLAGKREFEKYVKLSSQESLDSIFQSIYNPPFTINDINVETLSSSFVRLTNRKKYLSDIEFPDFSDLIKKGSAEDFEGLIEDVHFERDLNAFKINVQSKLPISISKLLNSAQDDKDRYTHFVYCLYLIQRKILVFDKSSNMLRKFGEEEDGNI